ncbi:MAG: PQQ-like beta-propeller repeat protein [Lewinellaceae bacterium]|nr:PQQ-like beta-propeller repeat protein [Saprospiraceae bacterium]MCB9339444.1 PQQ-like beta-propeller repeat protein [Lewinellaceae bacterium]
MLSKIWGLGCIFCMGWCRSLAAGAGRLETKGGEQPRFLAISNIYFLENYLIMYSKAFQIENIKPNHFKMLGNELLFVIDDGLYAKSNDRVLTKKIDFKANNIKILDDSKFLVVDGNGAFQINDLTSSTFLELRTEHGFNLRECSQDGRYCYYFNWINYYPVEIENGVYSIENFFPLWQNKESLNCKFVENELYAFPRKKIMERINPESGEKSWSYDLNAFPSWKDYNGTNKDTEVSIPIGIYDNKLFIGLTNGKVLVIETKSGKELALINHPSFSWDDYNVNIFPETSSMKINHQYRKIVGLKKWYYWEIDPVTLKVIHFDLSNDFVQNKIECSSGSKGKDFIMDENYIYFIDKANGKIGIFDIITHSLVWRFDFLFQNERRIFPMEIQQGGSWLCVLDNTNSLHVFDRNK